MNNPHPHVNLSWEEWIAQFHPIRNPFEHNNRDDFAFETYGKEFDYVKDYQKDHPHSVWTLVDSGDGSCIIEGGHFVNRQLYYLTEIPADANTTYTVDEHHYGPETGEKDDDAWMTGMGVCYVAEQGEDDEETEYTRARFMEVAGNRPHVAQYLFDAVRWQHPATLMDEEYHDRMLEFPEKEGIADMSEDEFWDWREAELAKRSAQ